MDGHSFDRIVRLWGTSIDRRRALRLIGAGILAGSWVRRGGRAAAAQETVAQMTCIEDADCRDGDADPCTGAACVDGLCTFFIVDCIAGYTCCGNGECCPVGEIGGCQADADCVPMSGDPCEGVRCEGRACVPFLVSCAPDFTCCGDGNCCATSGRCSVGTD